MPDTHLKITEIYTTTFSNIETETVLDAAKMSGHIQLTRAETTVIQKQLIVVERWILI